MAAKWIIGTAAVAVFASACSSGGGSGGGSQHTAGARQQVSITVAHDRLTASNGHTLYFNTVDTMSKISCSGECASEWPPLAGKPKAGKGVDQGHLATAKRSDGTVQVTYYGHPLYEFSGDKAAGDTNGNGLSDEGGRWIVATPAQAKAGAPKSAPSMSSGGGYSAGY
jgi:predicted lipoprotein with Yx(FWY)xxD motif